MEGFLSDCEIFVKKKKQKQKTPTMADFRFLRTHFFLVHPVYSDILYDNVLFSLRHPNHIQCLHTSVHIPKLFELQ